MQTRRPLGLSLERVARNSAVVVSIASLCGLAACSSRPLDSSASTGTDSASAGSGSASTSSVRPPGAALTVVKPQAAAPAPWAIRKPSAAQVLPASPGMNKTASGALADGLIVKFKSTGASSVIDSVDQQLLQRGSLASATADHSASLDVLAARHQFAKPRVLLPWRNGLSTAAAQTLQSSRFLKMRHGLRAATAPAADLTNVYHFEVGGDLDRAVAELAQDPHVAWAQPNYIQHASTFTPNDPYFSSSGSFGQPYADLWGLHSMSTEQAWDTTRGLGTVVAVVDTGVDRAHPDISANIWSNPHEVQNGIDDDGNGLIDDTWGWDFAYGDNNPIDRYGHGTHVAGTIAADDNNGIGIVGIAPDAKIMVLKGLDDTGSGSSFNLAQAILYAGEHGADVINNSWGCDGCGPDLVANDAIQQAHSLGSVVVFAAGNGDTDVFNSSTNLPDSIVVGANDPAGNRAFFSDFGLIDVVAPGSGFTTGDPAVDPFRAILSLKSSICSQDACPPALIVGQNYLRQAGTSMSAPHVAGLAALILAQHPTYTPEQVRQVIRRSADDLNGNGLDPDLGYGRVNALRAMSEPTPLEALITGPFGTSDAASVTVTGTARGTGFANWTLDYGSSSNGFPSTWTALAQGTNQVNEATLANWNVSGVADGLYTLRLRTLTTDGRSYEDRQTILFDRITLTGPDDRHVYHAGEAVQVTGTVAPGGFNHYQLAVETVDGTAVPGAQVTLAGGGTTPIRNGLLATWNTAGISANTYRLRLRIFLQDRTEQDETTRVIVDPLLHAGWPRQLTQTGGLGVFDTATVADVNGDGRSELAVGYGPTVQLLQGDGTALPGWPQNVDVHGGGSLTQFSPAIGDITGDGKPEVVVSNVNNEILAWSAQGVLLTGFPKTIGTATRNRIALADIDGDGVKDIVAADDTGSIKVLRSNGSLVPGFPVSVGSGIQENPSVADLDHDGKPEIVSVIDGTLITVVSSTGVVKPGWPKSGSFFFKGIGDLDGDGNLEIVTGGVHQVTAFRLDGSVVAGWPKDLGDTFA
ncbi:MAG TPA: S8 family serine peptidase, partial [Polyangiaceae bacterium]|nr:S8 family serine peptidase [Polyangiaceae bacterium]